MWPKFRSNKGQSTRVNSIDPMDCAVCLLIDGVFCGSFFTIAHCPKTRFCQVQLTEDEKFTSQRFGFPEFNDAVPLFYGPILKVPSRSPSYQFSKLSFSFL